MKLVAGDSKIFLVDEKCFPSLKVGWRERNREFIENYIMHVEKSKVDKEENKFTRVCHSHKRI